MLALRGSTAWITAGLIGFAGAHPVAAFRPPSAALDIVAAADVEPPTYGVSLLSALLPRCELQAEKAEFRQGDTVLASWAIANPSPLRVAVEFRVQLKAPGNAPVPRASAIGPGRTVAPPDSLESGRGLLPILKVEGNTTRGIYEMSCRVIDSSTGLLLAEDLNAFRIQ
ncbi:MAG: hypothetical protein VCB42_09330 [Myxococcota bacterium]